MLFVLAQEDLVRGMRRVGLALVDERRVGVRRVTVAVAPVDDVRPRVSDHEPLIGGQVVGVPEIVVGPATSGSSAFNGTKTVPLPPLVILSRP